VPFGGPDNNNNNTKFIKRHNAVRRLQRLYFTDDYILYLDP